jgi:hypothetical protein
LVIVKSLDAARHTACHRGPFGSKPRATTPLAGVGLGLTSAQAIILGEIGLF